MVTQPRVYGWTVTFSNDRMGFRKTVAVDAAATMTHALDAAIAELEKRYGDRVDEFYAIRAERQRENGT